MSTDQALPKSRSSDGIVDVADTLRAPYVEMVDAVAAEDGLERVAVIAGRAMQADVAIDVPRLGPPAVSTSRLARGDMLALSHYVRARLSGFRARPPESIVRDVPIRFAARTVGMVTLLSRPRRGSLAAAVEILHLAAAVAVTRVAIEETRDEVESDLRDTLIQELRSSVAIRPEEIVRRAGRFGCDLSAGGMAICANGEPARPGLMAATVRNTAPSALPQTLDGRLFAILPAVPGDDAAARTTALAESLAKRLDRYGAVGISSFYEKPDGLRQAIAEAELMLDVLRRSPAPVAKLIGTGSYRLLMRLYVTHPGDLHHFYETTVAPLVAYDERYGTELLRSLECYLEHNCNMNATAVAMFAHRHTIAYRLERIRVLSGLDPADWEHREQLGVGIKAHRILAPAISRGADERPTRRRPGEG